MYIDIFHCTSFLSLYHHIYETTIHFLFLLSVRSFVSQASSIPIKQIISINWLDSQSFGHWANQTTKTSISSGVSFTFSLSDEDVLEFSVELTSELTGLTTGLMGNFNDNPEDDFMDPSGTVMAPNATDRQIFEYVKKCKSYNCAGTRFIQTGP